VTGRVRRHGHLVVNFSDGVVVECVGAFYMTGDGQSFSLSLLQQSCAIKIEDGSNCFNIRHIFCCTPENLLLKFFDLIATMCFIDNVSMFSYCFCDEVFECNCNKAYISAHISEGYTRLHIEVNLSLSFSCNKSFANCDAYRDVYPDVFSNASNFNMCIEIHHNSRPCHHRYYHHDYHNLHYFHIILCNLGMSSKNCSSGDSLFFKAFDALCVNVFHYILNFESEHHYKSSSS
jgi:hypothetical protein